MFCMLKKKKKYPAYVSKHDSNREKQIILLTISDNDGIILQSKNYLHY